VGTCEALSDHSAEPVDAQTVNNPEMTTSYVSGRAASRGDLSSIARIQPALVCTRSPEVPRHAADKAPACPASHEDLIERGKVDVIQPDVVKCGGLTELRKIGVLASIFNRPIQCHNTQPTIGTAAH